MPSYDNFTPIFFVFVFLILAKQKTLEKKLVQVIKVEEDEDMEEV